MKLQKTLLVHRLEQCLRAWEDVCLLEGYDNRPLPTLIEKHQRCGVPQVPVEGPLVHSQEFRNHLLRSQQEDFDSQRFLGTLETQQLLAAHATFPAALFQWTQVSRRVFHLEEDLRCLLNATDLSEVRWSDVSWPFKSFLITFDRPIEGTFEDGHTTYDGILVSQHEWLINGSQRNILRFQLLSTGLECYPAFSTLDRERYRKAFQRQDWPKYFSLYDRQQAELRKVIFTSFMLEKDLIAESLVTESITRAMKRSLFGDNPQVVVLDDPKCDQTARLVVGLCLYLRMLPPNDRRYQTPWQHPQRYSHDSQAITNPAQVCVVKTTNVLTTEERQVFGGTRRYQEKCAHFRIGHWRRRPGEGRNPDAPKVVHVRPTLVRPDRLPEGGIPAGSQEIP